MKKIILVSHTHWDREWYFTDQTSAFLLERMKRDISAQKNHFPFNLDGQASLAEEISENNVGEYLTKYNITAGPLYIQQDTFNVMFGTTINNIELGQKVLGDNIPQTVYMPDTFGFNEQLPQIFKHYKFNNFVAWRGIRTEDKDKTNFFKWQGIDGTKINASYMSKGYYCMGQHFPYNQEKKYDNFVKELYKYIQLLETKDKRDIYWVPLGGDQAPYEFDVPSAVKVFNAKYKDYKVVIGTHDDYFNELNTGQKTNTIKTRLDYSGTSKIHRTIHSNRYDIKKSFRDAETNVYYVMEPMEILYKNMGGKLLPEDIKDRYIYKELLKSSAHDSLGGCNLDKTNQQILARNNRVIDFVKSYVDSMKRDIKDLLKLKKNQYIVFNLSPFKRDVSFTDIISTNNNKILGSTSGEILEFYQKNISWKEHDSIFNHRISIHAKNIAPLSYKIINITNIKVKKTKAIPLSLKLKVENDLGDEFDFAFDNKTQPKYYDDFSHVSTIENNGHIISKYELKKLNLNLIAIKNSNGIEYIIEINNKLRNKRISLEFPKGDSVKLSRHLALIEQECDSIDDWKKLGYKDMPINSFTNDGLITTKKNNILTRGNNEVHIGKNNIELTLYRCVGFLGKPEISTRPGSASGLPMKCETPDAQLQKNLTFNIAINSNNAISSLNQWNFLGTGYFASDVNPILNNVNRFVWNNIKVNKKQNENKFKPMKISECLIGRFNAKSKVSIIYTKPNESERIIWKLK